MDITQWDRAIARRHALEEEIGDLLVARGILDGHIERKRSELSLLPMGRRHARGRA